MESEALTLQQWMARSRKGSGQSSPTRVLKAGTSSPKSCGDKDEMPESAFLQFSCCPQLGPHPPGNPPWLQTAQSGGRPFKPGQVAHLGPGQVVRVCRDPGDELTEDNPKGKDVSLGQERTSGVR